METKFNTGDKILLKKTLCNGDKWYQIFEVFGIEVYRDKGVVYLGCGFNERLTEKELIENMAHREEICTILEEDLNRQISLLKSNFEAERKLIDEAYSKKDTIL